MCRLCATKQTGIIAFQAQWLKTVEKKNENLIMTEPPKILFFSTPENYQKF